MGSAATQVTQCGVFTPISAAPAPRCHHRLQSRSQLTGPRERGTVAGKAPKTCPHTAEGTPRTAPLAMRGCLAPSKHQTPHLDALSKGNSCPERTTCKSSDTHQKASRKRSKPQLSQPIRSPEMEHTSSSHWPRASSKKRSSKHTLKCEHRSAFLFHLFAKPIIYILAANICL